MRPAKPPPHCASDDDDEGERHPAGENRDEGRQGDESQRVRPKRPASDPEDSLADDCDDRCLDPGEEPVDDRDVPELGVPDREGEHGDEAGKHEEPACEGAAAHPVHQPAQIGGELLRLRAGQDHAVVERVQKSRFADPASFVDDFAVHDGDLACRATKAVQTDPCPDLRGVRQRDAAGCRGHTTG